MDKQIIVKDYKDLENYSAFVSPGTDAAVEIQENKFKLFTFDGKTWNAKTGKTNIGMSYYDMNKQMVMKLPTCNLEDETLLEKIQDFFILGSKYFMLLCRELNYYTVFHKCLSADEGLSIEQEFIDLFKNSATFTEVKSIDVYKDERKIEVWFLDENKEAHVAYLFPYDMGVIECTV